MKTPGMPDSVGHAVMIAARLETHLLAALLGQMVCRNETIASAMCAIETARHKRFADRYLASMRHVGLRAKADALNNEFPKLCDQYRSARKRYCFGDPIVASAWVGSVVFGASYFGNHQSLSFESKAIVALLIFRIDLATDCKCE